MKTGRSRALCAAGGALFLAAVAVTLAVAAAQRRCEAAAAAPVADPAGGKAEALMALVARGDFESVAARVSAGLNVPRAKIDPQVDPWKNLVGEKRPVYIDRIRHTAYGKTLKRYVYAVYYGKRRFIYVSLYYARLEDGWRLFDFSYNSKLTKVIDL